MKKETKEIKVVEEERVVLTEYFCDRCGVEIFRDSFSKTSYFMKLREGDVYPEGGNIEETHAYFCEPCAMTAKKALEGIGVKFETIETDY